MVDIKDVVVFVDRQPDGLRVIDFATRLSEEHRAHLTGAFVWPTLPAEGPASYARGRAIEDLLASHDAEVSAIEKTLRESFESAVSRSGLQAEWRSIRYFLAEELLTH